MTLHTQWQHADDSIVHNSAVTFHQDADGWKLVVAYRLVEYASGYLTETPEASMSAGRAQVAGRPSGPGPRATGRPRGRQWCPNKGRPSPMRSGLRRSPRLPTQPPSDNGVQADPVKRLQQAKQMLEQKLISDSEYEAIKAKIVNTV